MSLKIMIADDEPHVAALMRSVATPLGHTVLPFTDYRAAGERGEKQRFDVVFVGMRLPGMDGLRLAHRIRHCGANRESIIIMLSPPDDMASWRRAFGEGADLVLVKPVPADSLRRMLAAFPAWRGKRQAARLPLVTKVTCSWNGRECILGSLNISESGMLLQPSLDAGIGDEVTLEFKIAEVRASMKVLACVVRKEGGARAGVEFIDLAPEDRNAIRLYVTGR